MKNNNTNVSQSKVDNHVRLFNRLMADKELTMLQKIIISDIISYQIQGKQYFKTSEVLAKELGNVTKKTIQANFQKLNKRGFIDCVPLIKSGDETHSLREATVLNIEKWTSTKEDFEKLNLKAVKREEKAKDHSSRMLWPNRHKKSFPAVDALEELDELTFGLPIQLETPIKTSIEEKSLQSDLPIIDAVYINHGDSIRDDIRGEIAKGKEVKFFPANIKFGEDDYLVDYVVRASGKFNLKLTYVPKSIVYGTWIQDNFVEAILLEESKKSD